MPESDALIGEFCCMYRFWEPIIEPLFERLQPTVVVEIGSDHGLNTRNLANLCRRMGATLHVIDPLPKFDVEEWRAQYPERLVFHLAPSLEVLGSMDRADVVLIDGDHNWHTVFNELKLLENNATGATGNFPVVLLHDVGWPYARRDLYYDPDRIPSTFRHPYRRAGIRPGRVDLDPEGGLNSHLLNASQDGGPRNGVLTAVEDFISEASFNLEFVVVPGINDLGILYPDSLRQKNPAVAEFIEELSGNPSLRQTLERVEALRVEALVESLDFRQERDQLRSAGATREAQLVEEQARVRALSEELNQASARLSWLEGELEVARQQAKGWDAERERAHAQDQALIARKAEVQGLRRQLLTSRKKLIASEKRYKRLRSRRSVRLALKVATLAGPLVRPAKRLRSRAGRNRTDAQSASDGRPLVRKAVGDQHQTKLSEAIVRNRHGSDNVNGPLVSIVVLSRNGAEHMRRLLGKLDDGTRYRSFEVIVVDNGSTDETPELLKLARKFPLKTIRNDRNTSFSAGNNQGVEIAEGELLLFLNNDVEPINPGWLGAMVDAIQNDETVVGVGAELVYPFRGGLANDLLVQHSGIRFAFRGKAVQALNVGGADPLDPALSGTVEVPAATAAAFMVSANTFASIGGFDVGYVYGTEDVDLCLNLRERGKVVVTGQAVLFHHESATQTQVGVEITQINRQGNRQRFAEKWGPRLARSVMRDRLTGLGRWTGQRSRTVAITLTQDDASKGWGDYYTAHELGDAFLAIGWNVIYAERFQDRWYDIKGNVDVVVSLLDSYDARRAPDGAFTIAWIRNWVDRWIEQPWFDAFDVVTTSSVKSARLVAQRSKFASAVVPLATNLERFSVGSPNPTFESDYAFTGNNWGPGRKLLQLLDVHPGERFLMFGQGWEKEPRVTRYWRGSLPYDLLSDVYRSTKVVLDDTATPTLPHAFLNGRVFDALAAGAMVLTDNLEGSEEMFDGMLPTYSDRVELRANLDHYLTHEDERLELADRLRQRVVERHSYATRPAEFLQLALDHIERPKAAIKIAVPNEEVKATWGDTHFGEALAAAFRQLGMPTDVHILPEWDLPANQAVDVAIHLRGLASYTPKASHFNVLWIISHPDDVSVRECEKYDLVLVASRQHADWLSSQLGVPVVFMPQATDQRRFYRVEPGKDLATEVLFLGNSRGQQRPAVEWAISQGLPLTVYGGGWTGRIPPYLVRADHFPNDDLAKLYAAAKVVLNDHWPDMRDKGFISNRVFDALASGAVVVSDRAEGLEDMFGDLVPTYSSPIELEETVRELLTDHDRRTKISQLGSALVAKEHTFERRAQQIIELIEPSLLTRTKDLEGGMLSLDHSQ